MPALDIDAPEPGLGALADRQHGPVRTELLHRRTGNPFHVLLFQTVPHPDDFLKLKR